MMSAAEALAKIEPILDNCFHAHLDGCEQCRLHPHKLCVIGGLCLQIAAGRAIDRLAEDARRALGLQPL